MSAWIVSKAHIDTLVQALIAEGIVPMDQATVTGRMLWHENHLSIAARYGDDPDQPCVAEYVFEGVEAPLVPQVVLQAAGCYGYQSCEHSAWDASEACRLVGDRGLLPAALGARLGLSVDPEYGGVNYRPALGAWERETGRKAPWGIDDIMQAVAP